MTIRRLAPEARLAGATVHGNTVYLAGQEGEHRHREGHQRRRVGGGGEVRIAEEGEQADIHRQPIGHHQAEIRPGGEQQVEEAEPHRASGQRGGRHGEVGAHGERDQPHQR